MIRACPSCQETKLIDFYRVEDVPIQQNTPKPDAKSAHDVLRGDIQLAFCPACGFVTNRLFDPTLPIYGPDYNNCQAHSSVFSDYIQQIVEHLDKRHTLAGKQVIEVGCGDGSFLQLLCELKQIQGIGFDPSYTGAASACDDRLRFVTEYYGPQFAHESADLVVGRHLIEHIHNLDELLGGLQQAIGHQQAGLFFETPDVRWILQNGAFWDVFYEHCSLFSPGSIARLFARHGFQVRAVTPAFEDQYMWLDASTTPPSTYPEDLDTPDQIGKLAEQFASKANAKLDDIRDQLAQHTSDGKHVAVWGAGAKGVTFLNTLKPDTETLPIVVDINPAKQGRYIPGTAQRIIAPQELQHYNVHTIYIMNPNYEAEIKAQLAALRLDFIDTKPIE